MGSGMSGGIFMAIVGILAQGTMGSGVARRLADNGVEIRTDLTGRSQASAKRAQAAAMQDVGAAQLVESDFFLSIVPPSEALGTARRLAPLLGASARKPVYVDCNAISPETAGEVAAVIAPTGCAFADAGIIGGPPQSGGIGPTIYVAGPGAPRFAELRRYGLKIRVIDGPVGAASALKMSYAGITKGVTALGAGQILAASRAGAAAALKRQLAESEPELLDWLTDMVPKSYAKAYRFVGEMEEIAAFHGESRAEGKVFEGFAGFYRQLAADVDGAKSEMAALQSFFEEPAKSGEK
jgi:putative dehydrogenase